jgi:hypothetical protein
VLAVAGAGATLVRAAPSASPFVFAPGAEAEGAIAAGKVEVARAQQLARQKRFGEAAAILAQVDADHPAALHDCNLALAYLRAGALSRAQLAWDLSRLRGPAVPDWCAGDLARDLAAALHAQSYVPVTLAITPAGAEVEVDGILLRDLGQIWLATGAHTFTAHVDGLPPQSATVEVAAPAGRVTLALTAPVREPDAAPAPVRAAPDAAPPDAAAAIDTAPDLDLTMPPPPPAPRTATWPRYVGAGVGGLGLAIGVVFHVRAADTRDRANGLVRTSAAFATARSDFGTQRALALTGYAIGAAGLGLLAWQLLHHHADEHRVLALDVGFDGARPVLVLEGGW